MDKNLNEVTQEKAQSHKKNITCFLFNFPCTGPHSSQSLPGFTCISLFLKSPMASFFLDIRIMYPLLKFTLKGCSVSLSLWSHDCYLCCTHTNLSSIIIALFPIFNTSFEMPGPMTYGKPFHPSLEVVGGARIYNMLPLWGGSQRGGSGITAWMQVASLNRWWPHLEQNKWLRVQEAVAPEECEKMGHNMHVPSIW